ncbi:hypothetical protein ACGFYF_40495 [Streptomyces lavendulae]|uniref:hypothetical protein n=1 Tax=Streptomyces lavendulae TaxID=1914 RepID=UPI00371A1BE3
MNLISKIITAGAVVVPVMLIGAGASFADSGDGHDGHRHHASQSSDRHGHGQDGPTYLRSEQHASRDGAASYTIATGFDEHGDAYYYRVLRLADADGASSSVTASHS